MKRELAEKIVDRIIDDMTGRSGGDAWWDGIDVDITAEIKAEWVDIVMNTKD